MDNITFHILEFNSSDYFHSLDIRNNVLRKPLNRDLFSEDISYFSKCYHVGGFVDEQIVATLLINPINPKTIQIEQVAVDFNYQKIGIGYKMMQFSEEFIRANGYQEIILNARITAIEFYQKLGFLIVGEKFYKASLPHFKMKKVIKNKLAL